MREWYQLGHIADYFSLPVTLWEGPVKPFTFKVAFVIVTRATLGFGVAWLPLVGQVQGGTGVCR